MRRTRDRAEVEAFLADLTTGETPGSAVECRGGWQRRGRDHEPSDPHRHRQRVAARARRCARCCGRPRRAAAGRAGRGSSSPRSPSSPSAAACSSTARSASRRRSMPASPRRRARPTGPAVMVPAAIAPSVPGFVSTLRGLTDGAASADGERRARSPSSPVGRSRCTSRRARPRSASTATGVDGSVGESVVAVTDAVPAPAYPATAALHVRAEDWAEPGDPPAGPRPRRRRPDQRRRARHQGRGRRRRLRQHGPAGARPSVRRPASTTPARRSTSCTPPASGSSGGSSASSTR